MTIDIAGRLWTAIVDSGFNGDLELPEELQPFVNARFEVEMESQLAGNQRIMEDGYRVSLPFDGEVVSALATFVPGDVILIGLGMLRKHRLEINVPTRTVLIERV